MKIKTFSLLKHIWYFYTTSKSETQTEQNYVVAIQFLCK